LHISSWSSSVGLKVHCDLASKVLARGLYRMVAQRSHGYADAHLRQIFRDLIQTLAIVTVVDDGAPVRLHRRAHHPPSHASGLLHEPGAVPWWNGKSLTLVA
jgi:hypothetical protein